MPRAALVALILVLLAPAVALADHGGQAVDIAPIMVAPFVVLLLCVAILPLVAGHFWHSNVNKALVALTLAGPVVGYLYALDRGAGQPGLAYLGHSLLEYFEFILLLGSLYTVSGGIVLQGRLRPTPWTNTAFLLAGAILANFIGTTGASMLLIRPLLRINHPRQLHGHLPVFFIFAVSNLGGLLTPLGDPPLFLGYLRGVNFFFTASLWPHWLVAVGGVLVVFFVWDAVCYWREPATVEAEGHESVLAVKGLQNVLFLMGIVAAVLVKSPDVGGFLEEQGLYPLAVALLPSGLMALMGILSLAFTPTRLRQHNDFTWEALVEVAVLFLGIFITMVPALILLDRHGAELGLTEPWHYFWATGSLSAFLDNAPTYLTLATIAAHGRPLSDLAAQEPAILQAISAGAVFLGAMTYIGNGPNFMVKAIAEGMGYEMPSFFGYLLYSCAILGPIFVLVTLLFFAG